MTTPEITRRRAVALAGAGMVSLAGCIDGLVTGAEPDYGTPQFRERAREFGFEYEYVDDSTNDNMKSLVSNAGVYAADIDNDGRTDVLALGGETPVLFRNTGEGFERSDALPDIEGEVGSGLFLDYDNDGWDELLLLRLGAPPVFLDNERGEFAVREVGFEEAFENPIGASTADYNRDGYLDVYIAQNGNWASNRPRRMSLGGAPEQDNGNPNVLYRGDGTSFERVENAGLNDTRWTLATSFADLTDNGYPDIYVANDYNYDVLYANGGDGSFAAHEVGRSNRNAMSAAVADISGDGRLDVFVTNIYFDQAVEEALNFLPAKPEGNNLFIDQADGWLTDKASEYGVREGGWGWAATVSDFTNSGARSLFHTTTPLGAEHRIQQETGWSLETIYDKYPYLAYPMFYERTGETFTTRHPPDLGFEKGDGRGVVAMDITNTGSLDLVVADVNHPYRLYENQSDAGNWLQVEVLPAETMPAIGTDVTVLTSDGEQYQAVTGNADFLSQEPRTLHFGVRSDDTVRITVEYPDGREHAFGNVATNRSVVVTPDGDINGR